MYTKKDCQDQLAFAQMMKQMGTEVITAVVKGDSLQVDINLYIARLELVINEMDENAVVH